MNKFKIYKILDSTSSATYWSFINEEQEYDEFIECVQEKEISKDKLTELFDSEDDLGKSVLFESLLELVETSEEIAVKKFKEKINKLLELYKFKYTYELDNGYEETVIAFDFKLKEEILKLLEEKNMNEERDKLVIQTQMDGKGKAIKELLNKLMIAIEDNGTYHLRLDIFEQKHRQKLITETDNKRPIPREPRVDIGV